MPQKDKVDYIPYNRIKLSDRQRTKIDQKALEELKNSIFQDGLINPISLSSKYQLIAGERRMRAMIELHRERKPFFFGMDEVPFEHIPYVIVADHEDDLKVKEIELNENLMREDLHWADRARALAEIHKLRAGSNPEQTYLDTANEVKTKTNQKAAAESIGKEISQAVFVSDFLEDPDVAKARNAKDAFNIAARKVRESFAGSFRKKYKSEHTFIHGDALEVIPKLEDSLKFSCFILDPPYGVNAQTFHRGNGLEMDHEYDDRPETAIPLNKKLLELCFERAADNSHLWLFHDIEHFHTLREHAAEIGWQVYRTPIVWNSGTRGLIYQKLGFRRNYELILFCYKGDRPLSKIVDDIIHIPARVEEHRAQKPVELYARLLSYSCYAGEAALDPTCGTGTIFKAANALSLTAVGIEQSEKLKKTNEAVLIELAQDEDAEMGGTMKLQLKLEEGEGAADE